MTIIKGSPGEVVTATQPPQMLFPEANQRRRRRRVTVGLVVLLVLGGAISALTILALTSSPIHSPALPTLSPPDTTATGTIPRVAWSDYQGDLHVGNLSGFSDKVVAQTGADPTASLLAVGNGIFWVRSTLPTPNGTVSPIVDPMVQRFDLATGTVTTLGPGGQVVAPPDGSVVYVETDAGTGSPWVVGELAEYTPTGQPTGHDLHVPSGWFLSHSSLLGDPAPVTANGILVESAPIQIGKAPNTLAIWEPATGHVRIIGKVWKVIGTYTKPGANSSLIAWLPARCETVGNCPLEITDSSTLATRPVYSPLGRGFDWGGGFSPDGSTLAAFVPGPFDLSPTARLVLVTGSGKVHQVPRATINIGDALAWAAWFPDSKRLIVGGVGSPDGVPNDNHYLVNAVKRSATPFRFLSDGQIDINFSTTIIPRGG